MTEKFVDLECEASHDPAKKRYSQGKFNYWTKFELLEKR